MSKAPCAHSCSIRCKWNLEILTKVYFKPRSSPQFQCDADIRKQLASVHNLLFTLIGTLSPPSSSQIHPQRQWQVPSPSLPRNLSPQTQGFSSSTTTQRTSYSGLSTIAPTATLSPESHRSQERVEQPATGLNQTQCADTLSSSPTSFPSGMEYNLFQGIQYGLSSRVPIGYNIRNDTRDDSFTVIGTGNTVYFSCSR